MSITRLFAGLILVANIPQAVAYCYYDWYYNRQDCSNRYNHYGNNYQNEIRFSGAPAWGTVDGEYK